MWEPSQATLDKDINGLVLLASAGCRLFGERKHRETVYVPCGGKGTAPGCALQGSPKVPSVRPILSELLHTAGESAARNKGRAPSGPVKVLVTDREPKRMQNVVDVCSGASSLLAWFPASWATKIAPEFLANPTENGQTPQIQELACPKRAGADEGDRQHKLQAVRFSARDMPFFDLAIDSAIRDGDYFAELIQGYSDNLIEPNIMRALQPVKPCRTTLEVIIPSKDGLSPDQWKETATLCPLDWPSNYSLLRLWHMQGSLQKTENDLRLQTGHSHMFTSWTVHHHLFAERSVSQATYFRSCLCSARPHPQWHLS